MPLLTIATWNTQFASPRSDRGSAIRRILSDRNADGIVLTEAHAIIAPDGGYVIESDADYGYASTGQRRKVVLWSRQPWTVVDAVGHPGLPTGRFVAGSTETPVGNVRVLGVCIPWKDAHVLTGRKDRRPWDDHMAYVDALTNLLRSERHERCRRLESAHPGLSRFGEGGRRAAYRLRRTEYRDHQTSPASKPLKHRPPCAFC